MSDLTPYTNLFLSAEDVRNFATEIYKYTQNPLVLPFKTFLINALSTKLKTVISKSKFKKRLKVDMNLQSMFTGYLIEVDTNTDETVRLEKLRMLIGKYIKSKDEGSEVEAYEIYKIARKLTSFEFVVLSTAYKVYKNDRADHIQNKDLDLWRKVVSENINDSDPTRALIYAAEKPLENYQLIQPSRGAGFNSYSTVGTFRLTKLGIRMCELLEEN